MTAIRSGPVVGDMRPIDGFELCSVIRTNYDPVTGSVLFATSSRSPEDVRQPGQVGGDYFVVKPFTRECLSNGIKNASAARPTTMRLT